MKPTLLILLAVFIVVLVVWLTREPPAPGQIADDDPDVPTTMGKVGNILPLGKRPLPGEEPDVPPVFQVQVEVPQDAGGTRIYLHITEEHGYYVETFNIHLHKKETPGQFVDLRYNRYLEANGTLTLQENIVDRELLNLFGGEMGTSEDWGARVQRYGRAREENPDRLPEVVEPP